MVAVSCESIVKRYRKHVAVDSVSLDVSASECVALLGPSGAGKTTMLRLVAGLETLDEGCIRFNERVVSARHRHEPPNRRRVAMVFQDQALWAHLTVQEQFRLVTGGRDDGTKMLAELGLAHLPNSRPTEISGGEAQRIAWALALSSAPDVLLLDEPWGQLDAESVCRLDSLYEAFRRQSRCTCLLVTHDRSEAARWSDRVAVLEHGRLHQVASFNELYCRPASKVVARQTGEVALIEGVVQSAEAAETALGVLPICGDLAGARRAILAIRPEHWQPTQNGGVRGRVVFSQFVDGRWLTAIETVAGRLVAYCPERAAPGESVCLKLIQRPWAIRCL